MKSQSVLSLKDVHKSFTIGQSKLEIIKGVSFDISPGDFVIIFGPSGCGKSTILNMILGLEVPSSGEVLFNGTSIYKGDEDDRAELRKKEVGMVYQQSNWIKALTVVENVAFPLMLVGIDFEQRHKKALELLELVGMKDSAEQVPTELSSGQQQRVSLARALMTDPTLIVADEPTGNLDSKAGEIVMELFNSFNVKGKTVIMVTHDLEYLRYATKSINISDGKIIGQYGAYSEKLKSLSVSKRGFKGMDTDPDLLAATQTDIEGQPQKKQKISLKKKMKVPQTKQV